MLLRCGAVASGVCVWVRPSWTFFCGSLPLLVAGFVSICGCCVLLFCSVLRLVVLRFALLLCLAPRLSLPNLSQFPVHLPAFSLTKAGYPPPEPLTSRLPSDRPLEPAPETRLMQS